MSNRARPLSCGVGAVILVGLVVLAGLLGWAWLQEQLHKNDPAPGTQTEDEARKAREEIQQVLDAQVAAWNRGDLDGFMQAYWHSEELTFYSGRSKTNGWQATLERYRNRYQAEGAEMGQLSYSEVRIQVIGSPPQEAWVRGRWQLVLKNGKRGGLFTLLLVKQADGWKIVHEQTSG